MEPRLVGTSFKKRSMKLPNIMKTESNICGGVSWSQKVTNPGECSYHWQPHAFVVVHHVCKEFWSSCHWYSLLVSQLINSKTNKQNASIVIKNKFPSLQAHLFKKKNSVILIHKDKKEAIGFLLCGPVHRIRVHRLLLSKASTILQM